MCRREEDEIINVTNAFNDDFSGFDIESGTCVIDAEVVSVAETCAVDAEVDRPLVSAPASAIFESQSQVSNQISTAQESDNSEVFRVPDVIQNCRDKLEKGLCLFHMEFEDGSVIESITTAHRLILSKCGVNVNFSIDFMFRFGVFYDLETKLPIPREYLKYVTECRSNVSKTVTGLDKFLEIGGKFWWNNTKTFSSHKE